MKLYPCGYAAYAAQIWHLMEEHPDLLMIDTRLKPWSQMQMWREESLRAIYGERYRWYGQSLGNLNYKTGGPVRLADAETSLRNLRCYWQAMRHIYTQAHVALRGHGYLIIVVKDHIHNGQRVLTADRTITLCKSLGFVLHARHQRQVFPLSLWQRRRKERGVLVVEEEDALVFRKQESEVGI
jgi:hypothetical protein